MNLNDLCPICDTPMHHRQDRLDGHIILEETITCHHVGTGCGTYAYQYAHGNGDVVIGLSGARVYHIDHHTTLADYQEIQYELMIDIMTERLFQRVNKYVGSITKLEREVRYHVENAA